MRVLGIDPGSRKLGIGIIDNGSFLNSSVINLKDTDFQKRLLELSKKFSEVLEEFEPHVAFLESTIYYKNVKTAIQLGAIRGVVLLELAKRDIPTLELSPTKIKGAITGNGQAKKSQVAYMVKILLNIPDETMMDENATDALACALAGLRSMR